MYISYTHTHTHTHTNTQTHTFINISWWYHSVWTFSNSVAHRYGPDTCVSARSMPSCPWLSRQYYFSSTNHYFSSTNYFFSSTNYYYLSVVERLGHEPLRYPARERQLVLEFL